MMGKFLKTLCQFLKDLFRYYVQNKKSSYITGNKITSKNNESVTKNLHTIHLWNLNSLFQTKD